MHDRQPEAGAAGRAVAGAVGAEQRLEQLRQVIRRDARPVEHEGDAAHRDALKACDLGPMRKPGIAGACGEDVTTAKAIPAKRADRVAIAAPEGGDVQAVGSGH